MENTTDVLNSSDPTPADNGPDLYGPERGFLVTYLTLLCITTVSGNIGNMLVIGAVTTDKRLRKAGNVFILNLAIADLCVTGKNEQR